MSERILEALKLLDPNDDKHWTNEGLPTVALVQELSGVKDLKRADITALAPEFTREALMAPPEALAPELPLEGAVIEEVTPKQPEEMDLVEARAFAAEIDKKVLSKQEEINALTRELTELTKQRDRVLVVLDAGTTDHVTNQKNIMSFIESQQRQREKRASLRNQALGHLTPADLDPRSTLDRSFGRKNDRGSVPPTRRT